MQTYSSVERNNDPVSSYIWPECVNRIDELNETLRGPILIHVDGLDSSSMQNPKLFHFDMIRSSLTKPETFSRQQLYIELAECEMEW